MTNSELLFHPPAAASSSSFSSSLSKRGCRRRRRRRRRDVAIRFSLPTIISMIVLLQVVLFETGGYHGGVAVKGFVVPSPPIIRLSRERRCQQLQQRHHSSDSKKVQLLPNDIIDITETTDVTNELMTSMIGSTTTTITTAAMISLNLPINIPTIFGGLIVIFVGWLYIDGGDDRNRTRNRIEEEEQYNRYQLKRYKNAVLDYKEYWTLEELSQYDGTGKWKNESKSRSELELESSSSADNDNNDNNNSESNDDDNDDDDDFYYDEDDGPILFAADGLVFNVYKGRNFYGMGGEYHIFAGRDATRLLAKTKVEEESSFELTQKLNIAERAALAAWIYTFKSKGYDIVGKLQDFDPSTTSMM
jgi:membrane-associated progesterone receptor component